MATSLIKKAFLPLNTAKPIPVMTDNLLNHEELTCPFCEQVYVLGFSQGEESRLDKWRAQAIHAIRRSHADEHDLIALNLPGAR